MSTKINKIIKQEKQLYLRKDPISVLSDLLDDEFMEIGSSSKIYGKEEVIRWFMSNDKSVIDGNHFKAKMISKKVILLTYISISRKNNEEKPSEAFRSSIWRECDGKWRLVFHQGTPII